MSPQLLAAVPYAPGCTRTSDMDRLFRAKIRVLIFFWVGILPRFLGSSDIPQEVPEIGLGPYYLVQQYSLWHPSTGTVPSTVPGTQSTGAVHTPSEQVFRAPKIKIAPYFHVKEHTVARMSYPKSLK